MSVIELYGVLHRYGVDVLLLALGVTVLTSILKKTVMKSVNRKVFVFLPFGLGILLYGIYSLLGKGELSFTAEGLSAILEGGLSAGCAATLYYVVYEQFLRGKLKADPLLPLLECVPEARRTEASAALSSAVRGLEGEGRLSAIAEQLSLFADPPLSEEELLLTAGIVKEVLDTIA